jgi:hypothetical protein
MLFLSNPSLAAYSCFLHLLELTQLVVHGQQASLGQKNEV